MADKVMTKAYGEAYAAMLALPKGDPRRKGFCMYGPREETAEMVRLLCMKINHKDTEIQVAPLVGTGDRADTELDDTGKPVDQMLTVKVYVGDTADRDAVYNTHNPMGGWDLG